MNNIEKFLKEVNKVFDTENDKTRLGNKGDGGYVVYKNLFNKVKNVYSLGIGNDISFELELLHNFPDIEKFFLFDPTIDYPPQDDVKFEFFKKEGANLINLPIEKDSILKMDIEWDEWEVFLLLNQNTLRNFSQMFIEIHLINVPHRTDLSPYFNEIYNNVYDKVNDVMFETHYKVLKRLNEIFYIYHIHANNSLPKVKMGGYEFPPLIELSLVRKDLIECPKRTNKSFPIEALDYPNKTDRPDIFSFFPFI